MSYGIVAQFVERKNKLFVYEVRGFNGGAFETMIKENANNYRGLRQVKNIDEPTDGSFVGCYYEPKMETSVMFKDDDNTNAGLSILTTFTFVTNDDLTFLQETNKFYVFTVNKPFADGDKTYILNGQAIRMTKQSGDVDLRSQGLPTNRNFTGEMWCLGLQEVSKLINDQKSNIIFYHNEISELPDDVEVWIDKTFEIGLESSTLINQIFINVDLINTETNSEFKNINLNLKTENTFLFPVRVWPIDIQNDNIFLYLHDYDKTRMDLSFVKEFLQLPSNDPNNEWISVDDNLFEFNENISFKIDSQNLPAIVNKWFDTSEPPHASGVYMSVDINVPKKTIGIGEYENASLKPRWQMPSMECIFNNLYISTLLKTNSIWIWWGHDDYELTNLNWQIKESDAYSYVTPLKFLWNTVEHADKSMTISVWDDDLEISKSQNIFNFLKFAYALSGILNNPTITIAGQTSTINSILLNFYLTNDRFDADCIKTSYDETSVPISTAQSNLIMNVYLKSNFFNIFKKTNSNDDAEIYLTPKIDNISFPIRYTENIFSFNFPLLPTKLDSPITVSTDLSQIDIKTNDFLKYLCFMPCNSLETFNNLFLLLKDEKNNLVNAGKLAELHEKIDPVFSINKFNVCSFKVTEQFSAEKYRIKKINSFVIKNIYGNENTKKIRFWYKEQNIDKYFDFKIVETLFSNHADINTTTITIF